MTNTYNLNVLIDDVRSGNILLPDFQREFVWNKLEKQKALVASVLAGLPIGSLLLLEGTSNEFSSKQIGRTISPEIEPDSIKFFLLDGQQRLTVLTNVFSNVIFDGLDNWNNVANSSLKTRFFIKFSNINGCHDYYGQEVEDIFGLANLIFPFRPDKDEPNFLTSNAEDVIETRQFTKSAISPIHPDFKLSEIGNDERLLQYCSSGDDFIIPLFLLGEVNDYLITTLIEALASKREKYLTALFNRSSAEDKLAMFVKYFSLTDPSREWITPTSVEREDSDRFAHFVDVLKKHWIKDFQSYLQSILHNLKVTRIDIKGAQRARAIDIYESLNMGGVKLSTFDLIIAKAAKEYTHGFYKAFITELTGPLVVPDFYSGELAHENNWNPSEQIKMDEPELSKSYIDVFLNLLSIVNFTNQEDRKLTKFSIDLIKRDKILTLQPQQILSKYKLVVLAINRALMLLQMNCGIRKMDDISYDHLLLGLSYFLYDTQVFEDKKKTNILLFWYWTSVFGGRFDKDQTPNIIADLELLTNNVYENKKFDILKNRQVLVFNAKGFSDKKTLLLENVKDFELYPKEVLRHSICQYVLSNSPVDFIENLILLNPWSGYDLDEHHIVPLNNVMFYKESQKGLNTREEKGNIRNSPLNFTFILRNSNNVIGSEAIESYKRKLSSAAIINHFIDNEQSINNEDEVKLWLSSRFSKIEGSLMHKLTVFASSFIPNEIV